MQLRRICSRSACDEGPPVRRKSVVRPVGAHRARADRGRPTPTGHGPVGAHRPRADHGQVSARGYAHDVPSPVADLDPARLLDDLNDAQREAVQAVEGPVVILAAAGTGKTRVISRRTAYAIATACKSRATLENEENYLIKKLAGEGNDQNS